jgi:serine protease Do
VLTPKDSPRGKLLQQYVLARVVTMTGIDIGLFDFDRHNSIYFFALHADEQIYLRYGGRDAEDANTYLDLDSFELALEEGLRQHELYRVGKLIRQVRPPSFFPEQIVSLKEQVIDRNRCVECHLIGDYLAQDLEKAGKLDKRQMLYPSPDLKRLGIFLEIPKGLLVERAEAEAATSGLQAGDLIRSINGTAVITFGDLQYRWGKVDRDARQVTLGIERKGEARTLTMRLPEEWWYIDTTHRYWTTEPMVYFSTRTLGQQERQNLKLPANGFAAEVVETDPMAESLKVHALRKGDIVVSVNGLTQSPWTRRPELYLKLAVRAGDTAKLGVLREGKPMDLEIRTHRQYFRKEKTD